MVIIIVVVDVVLLGEVVLVVVHPHFEDSSLHSNFLAELLHHTFFLFLNFPPDFLGKVEHFLLLILRKLCSVSFLHHLHWPRHNPASALLLLVRF